MALREPSPTVRRGNTRPRTNRFCVPAARDDLVISRPRLIDVIQEPTIAKVTLVVAGAGYGKSTLLTSFVRQADRAVGGLRLTVADNDPWVFTRHMVDVLREFDSSESPEGNDFHGSWDHVDPTVLPFEVSAIAGDFCLLLDDCEVISNPRVISLIDAVIESLPESGSIILAGRTPLPLRLARLRAGEQVRDVGKQELRFTIPETEAFLRTRESPETAENLSWHIWNESAGWAAGIALAGMAWHRSQGGGENPSPDPERSWISFVAEYVEEEILSALPAELRRLLLLTSDLPYLSNKLLETAIGSTSQVVDVEDMARRFQFIEKVADQKGCYSLHPLVRTCLQDLAERDVPAGERHDVQSLAVTFLTEQGDVRAAAQVALQHPDSPWLKELIDPICRRLADRSDFDGLLELLDQVPPTLVASNPALQYWHVISRLALGRTRGVRGELDANEAILRELGYPLGLGRISVCRGFLAYHEGHYDAAELAFQAALERLPEKAMVERMYCHTMLGQIDLNAGNDPEAEVHFEHAIALSEQLPPDGQWVFRTISAERGNTYAFRGELSSAITKYDLMIDELTPALAHLEGALRCRLVALWIERDDLEQAQSQLRVAERLRSTYPGSWHHDLALVKARLLMAQGNTEAANRVASSYIKQLFWLPEKDQFLFLLARIWLSRGELSLVRHWLADSKSTADLPPAVFGDLSHRILSIESALAEGRTDDAARDAESLACSARSTRRWSTYVDAKMRLAVALHLSGDVEGAQGAARAALQVGLRGGFVRAFLVLGFDTVGMFGSVMQETREGQELRRRLARALVASKPSIASQLTSREIEILKRVDAGQSNREIADALFISANTVRNHLVKAFRNLEARSRSEAVSRARELGILDQARQ
jgi:LuxR family transcriptional regulator, maltose regulon positive regulatory protein